MSIERIVVIGIEYWQSLPLNCYLTVLLTTLSAWKEYSISNLLALLSRMISVGKLTLTR